MTDLGRGEPAGGYRDLIAWQKGIELVVAVYRLTATWPAEERLGLVAQTRRAAVSVPSNIAEGAGRFGNRHLRNHLQIAHGSLSELETQLLIAQRLGFSPAAQHRAVMDLAAESGRVMRGLLRSLESQ